MEQLIALILIILFLPLFFVLFILAKLTSIGPFIFKQKRLGKDKKSFYIYKIRTMVIDAEELKSRILHLNEADGPVFKIHNDPRYTKFGSFLAHSGIDELLQLVNIVKGEMAFVGPRPLPVKEALQVQKKYEKRFSVLPGMSSPWVVDGADHSSFDHWMKLDVEYVKNKNFWYDLNISIKTIILLIKLIIKKNK